MKWLVDNQLPHSLCTALKKRGHQAIHTSELPTGSTTSDERIRDLSTLEGCVVVTKDGDFLDSYELRGVPARLVFVSTGNIRNSELIFLFMSVLDRLCETLTDGGLVELDRTTLTVR